MASLGINLGRMSNGMGAFGLMMAASRLFSFGHSSHSTTESMENGEHTGNSEAMGTSSGMGDGAGPIPMSTGNPMDMEEMGEDYVSGIRWKRGMRTMQMMVKQQTQFQIRKIFWTKWELLHSKKI